jgi:hypothetical protein
MDDLSSIGNVIMANYIYSTMTDSVNYTFYEQNENRDVNTIIKQILIKGGANLPDKHFITPLGVVTSVSDDDLEWLESNPVFQQHKKAGFITIHKKKVDIEKVVCNMTHRDEASPLTPEDYPQVDANGQRIPRAHLHSVGALNS